MRILFKSLTVVMTLSAAYGNFSQAQRDDRAAVVNPSVSGSASIDELAGFCPLSEANCVTTALYASGDLPDFVFVDPYDLSDFLLPQCFQKTETPQSHFLTVAFATSGDKLNYRNILHVFFSRSASEAFNKAGPLSYNCIETGSSSHFRGQLSGFYESFESVFGKNSVRQVEYYTRKSKDYCPFDRFEEKLRKYIQEPLVFSERSRIANLLRQRSNILQASKNIPELEAALQSVSEKIEKLEVQRNTLLERQFQKAGLKPSQENALRFADKIQTAETNNLSEQIFFHQIAKNVLLTSLGQRDIGGKIQ